MKHVNAAVYQSAVRKQTAFLRNNWIIPVEGLCEDLTFYMKHIFLATNGIHNVTRHGDTTTKGRWNVHTTHAQFRDVVSHINTELSATVNELWSEQQIQVPDGFPAARLAFKNQPYDDNSASDGSFQSYVSACTSVYTIASDDANNSGSDQQHTNAQPVTQAWRSPVPVPTVVEISALNSPSTITQDDLDRVTNKNNRLTREIQELRSEMRKIAQQQQSPPPPTPPPHPPAPVIDYASILSAVIKALDSRQALATTISTAVPATVPLQQHQHSGYQGTSHSSLPSDAETNPPPMDMSFAVNISQIDHDNEH